MNLSVAHALQISNGPSDVETVMGSGLLRKELVAESWETR